MAGVRMSEKKADTNHQYGHERFECIAAVILAGLLFATGVGIGYGGISNLVTGAYREISAPGFLALIAAAVSIVVKEGMYWYTRAAAKRVRSGALLADAWHHRSDALSSIGSLVGVVGAQLGFKPLDSIAAIVISLFILKVAVSIFIDSMKKMTDEACPETTVARIREVILSHREVVDIDNLKTRKFGERIYVDIEIAIDAAVSFVEAHNIATLVHDDLEREFVDIKHCTVHANPR
jgi:cation diffusion facilitator family transporter